MQNFFVFNTESPDFRNSSLEFCQVKLE